MAIILNLEERKLLLKAELMAPFIHSGLKKLGFTDNDIELADKYLGLQVTYELVAELIKLWRFHNPTTFYYRQDIISVLRIACHVLPHKNITEKIEEALGHYSLYKWQDVLQEISKEGYTEVSDDLIKCLVKLTQGNVNFDED
ncbi:hypothetical protein [Candidatus Avelusimicrobium alvi]|uniref:hypothetical protein n=1 Tax=Candidatus Avelusimicrobium alvi TaxID=3416221 RepID=UPI003D14DAA2